jgi:hypothetical protein
MPSPTLYEVTTAVAAIVSAVGGCAAAIAAFKSAHSARDAASSANNAIHRSALREVSAAANSVVIEVTRLQAHAVELDTQYQAASMFSGSFQHSGFEELQQSASELATSASRYASDAALFTGGAKSLDSAPPEEVDRVLIRMTESMAAVRAIHDEITRKFEQVSAVNAEIRTRIHAAK